MIALLSLTFWKEGCVILKLTLPLESWDIAFISIKSKLAKDKYDWFRGKEI